MIITGQRLVSMIHKQVYAVTGPGFDGELHM